MGRTWPAMNKAGSVSDQYGHDRLVLATFIADIARIEGRGSVLIRLRSTTSRRTRLRWMAVGTATGGLAWLLPWIYLQTTKPEIFYVLSYTRNTGPVAWTNEALPDPAARLTNISDYPIQIARKCKVKSWTIADNSNVTDTDNTARLRIAQNLVDDSTFNCLSDFVRPPYVRLERGDAEGSR